MTIPASTPAHEVLQDIINGGNALQRLRTELHSHRLYPSISYDQGTRLHIVNDVTICVTSGEDGPLYSWQRAGEPQREPNAEQCAPLDDIAEAARRIAAFHLALRAGASQEN
ncbi:hypothetical protein ABZU75_45210 [Streptosporangium sp. NPDC005286]|uniref:hypothetical protein n=1 Tax=Streptosporangium sp. NPDC005286 TaxID=3154463 RepID=UPI0033BEF901